MAKIFKCDRCRKIDETTDKAFVCKDEKKRVLIVDDETDITLPLKVGLEDNGFEADAFNEPLIVLSNLS